MNNKGQSLVSFVILLPVLLIFLAFVIDTSYMYKEKSKLENVTETIITNLYDERLEKNLDSRVIKLYKKNHIPSDNTVITVTNNRLQIENNYKVDSIFGKVIGIKEYKIKVNLNGYYADKLIIEKE